MRRKKQKAESNQTPKAALSSKQIKNLLGMVIFFTVFVIFLWVTRYPRNYVYMFLGNYSGTDDVVNGMDGEPNSEEDLALLLPYQQDFDDWKEQNLATKVNVTSSDELSLNGKLYDQGSNVTVIYLHTLASSSDGDFLYAPYYWDKGYNILMPDNRAHGDSEGGYTSYGYYETDDLVQWISLIKSTYGNDNQIIIQGDTMGATIALMASAKLPEQVKFIIADSPINNLYDGGNYMMKNQFISFPFMMKICDYYADKLTGIHLEDVNTVSAVSDNKIPLILMAGNIDTVVDPQNVEEIKSATSADCTVIDVKNAGHQMTYVKDQQEIEDTIQKYIDKYISQ